MPNKMWNFSIIIIISYFNLAITSIIKHLKIVKPSYKKFRNRSNSFKNYRYRELDYCVFSLRVHRPWSQNKSGIVPLLWAPIRITARQECVFERQTNTLTASPRVNVGDTRLPDECHIGGQGIFGSEYIAPVA